MKRSYTYNVIAPQYTSKTNNQANET